MNYGFVGLGAMGFEMAGHLARQAPTTVWNRTASRAVDHAARFGSLAVSELTEIARCDVIFSCLPTSQETEQILQALLPHLQEGQLWIDCTSGVPAMAEAQAAALAQVGVRFVDAPVSGGTSGAAAGGLTAMLGGGEQDAAEASQHLHFAAKVVHVGPVGSGFAVKAANNALLAAALLSSAEALAILKAHGVSLPAALEVINSSSGRSNATENLVAQRVFSREFPPTFALGLLAKDVGIAFELAATHKNSTPFLALMSALLNGAVATEGASSDHTALFKTVERNNALEIS